MEYSQLPEWNAQGVEPPQTKKNSGWQPGERPPAPWFNWLFHRIYQSFIEIRNAFNSHEEATQGVHGLGPTETVESTAGAQAKADAALAAAKAYADEAVAAHAGRTDNPHGVTKSQVGLGNVENYPVASQAEAEAGTANNRYMTPLRTRQAIEAYGTIPRGVIVMWSGSINQIPQGWALCDGTNGTPDLRDRFIVGAGLSYQVGEKGGAAQVTLTVEQLPPHSHQGTTSAAGAHTHTYSGSTERITAGSGGGHALIHPSGTLQTSESGLHSHTFTTQATGGGQPHENRPPYYALAYIMKL